MGTSGVASASRLLHLSHQRYLFTIQRHYCRTGVVCSPARSAQVPPPPRTPARALPPAHPRVSVLQALQAHADQRLQLLQHHLGAALGDLRARWGGNTRCAVSAAGGKKATLIACARAQTPAAAAARLTQRSQQQRKGQHSPGPHLREADERRVALAPVPCVLQPHRQQRARRGHQRLAAEADRDAVQELLPAVKQLAAALL